MRHPMLTRRAIVLHVTILIVVPVFAALCDWQVHRALSGNQLSWAYVFEWPFFAGYAVYLWWKLLHDQPTPDEEAPAAHDATTQAAPPSTSRTDPKVEAEAGAAGAAVAVSPLSGADGGLASPLLRADASRPGPSEGASPEGELVDEDDDELAAYNRYLAELHASDVRKSW